MITEAEAVRRVGKAFPKMRIVSGMDMGSFFAFQMMGRDVQVKSLLDIPIQPALQAIRKGSGAMFLFSAFQSDEGEFKGYVDVTSYLSAEDAEFARNYKTIMENG